jgi:large exoprotein involved in heme utilization and adhesion
VNADGTLSFPDGVARADVSLTNAAQVNVSAGDGGSIAVNARNFDISERSRLIGGIKSRMGGDGAQAGDIVVNATGAVTLAGRDSTIRNSVNTDSIGQSGDIEITAESLSLTGGAQLDTTIYDRGQGKAGNIRVRVDETVTLEGVEGRRSRIHSEVEEEAKGNGGDISIEAKSVYLTNGSQLNTQTSGEGNAGNIKLTLTDTLSLDGVGNNQPSSISSPVAEGARGNGGNISVIAESVFVTNGGQFNLTTRGAGNAGSLSISAGSTVSFDGDFQRSDGNVLTSTAKTQVESDGDGNGGTIYIEARSIFLTNGALLLSDTKTENEGNAGNITIIASESLLVSGVSEFVPEYSSAIISSANGTGNGGNITIEAGTLTVSDGGFIDANTNREGMAGNVTILADAVTVHGVNSNGSHSRLVAQTDQASTNDGGNLEITTSQLTIQDGGQVSVSSTGLGDSGSLIIKADIILLENQGMLSASTASGEGGNISLQVDDYILMRGKSLISAEADNNGNGGNIMINAPFIVAVAKEDNDIIANAFQGQGGNINITAQGIYGLEYKSQLSSLSDINASSEFGVEGVVELNTPDFDPTQGVAKLPDEPVNSPEVAEGCQGGGKQGTVAFFNAGRGGLAPSPHEALSPIQLWEDMPQSAQGTENPVVADIASTSSVAPHNAIIEAQGWITNEKGEVTLVAEVPATQSQGRCRLR